MSQGGPITTIPIFEPIFDPPPTNTGAGGARKAFDFVTFTPNDDGSIILYLKLESAWTRKCGLEPDINRAVVSYVEFQKLGGNADRIGKVQFWSSGRPGKGNADVTLLNERIIAVEVAEQGEIPGGTVVPVEWRIFIADFREQYVEPRGGRLEAGIINAGEVAPYSSGKTQPEPTAPEMKLSELIALCLTKMGMTGATLPDSIDDATPPRDLKWFGNHAPSELAKLLSLCSCAFVPELNGLATIQKITDVGTPALPAGDALPEQQVPKVDRRGKVCVFSSYPRASIGTETTTGPDPDTWFFVVMDSTETWVPIETCDLLKNAAGVIDVAGAVRSNFSNVPEEFRDRMIHQAYRCIQCNQTPPASVAPILTQMFESDQQPHPIQVRAVIAVQNSRGLWRNAGTPIVVNVLYKTDEDVLVLARALATVTTPTYSPDVDFGGAGTFTVRASFTVTQTDAQSGKVQPSYYHVGFSAGVNGSPPVKLAASDVENAIDGNTRDAIILLRPQWRLYVVDGQEVNRSALDALAAKEAAAFLADASKPGRILSARAFANVSPSGLVSEVQWDQAALKTTLHLADWYIPGDALRENQELRKREAGETGAYPKQAETEATRTANGEPGAMQPVLPIQAPMDGVSPPVPRLVQVTDIFPGVGFYTCVNVFGSAQQLGKDAIAGNPLAMPEGLTSATSDRKFIGFCPLESGTGSRLIQKGSYTIAFPYGSYTPPAVAGKPAAPPTEVVALLAFGEVDIQITKSATESGTYVAVIPAGQVFAESADANINFKMPAVGQSIPAHPILCYFQNLAESGLKGWMLPTDGSCWVRGGYVGVSAPTDDGVFSPIYHGVAPFSMDVTVYNDGGNDGSPNPTNPTASATQNTYTYTVFDGSNAITLATGLKPMWAREYGHATPGTNGRIRIWNGSVQLLDVDDVILPGTC